MQTPRRPLGQLRRALLIASVFSAFSAAATLAVPVFALQAIETVLPTGSREILFVLAGIAGVALLFALVLDVARELTLVRAGVWIDHTVQPLVIRQGLVRGLDGATIKSLAADVQAVRRALTGGSVTAVLELPWLLACCALVSLLSPYLAMACAAAVALPVLAALVAMRKSQRLGRDEAGEWLDRITADASRASSAGFAAGVARKWEQLDRKRVGPGYAAFRRRATLRAFTRFMAAAGLIGLFGVGGYLVIADAMLPGAAVAAVLLAARIGAAVDQIMVGSSDISAARSAWRNIAASDIGRPSGAHAPKSGPEWITLENVTARHGNSKQPAIRDVSLAIAPGECLGVIGPRSSGKSSLLAAIAGELAPQSGKAAIGSSAIVSTQRHSERNAIGYVVDTPSLLPGTVAENIAGFAANADEMVVAAAVKAGAHEAILALPQGYHTEVGDGGAGIPMRARRAIALARALFGNPIAVVLDEPELGLDATERSRLVGILDQIRRDGRTLVIATGDPSLLRLTDRVALMENGRIGGVLPSQQITGARSMTPRQVA